MSRSLPLGCFGFHVWSNHIPAMICCHNPRRGCVLVVVFGQLTPLCCRLVFINQKPFLLNSRTMSTSITVWSSCCVSPLIVRSCTGAGSCFLGLAVGGPHLPVGSTELSSQSWSSVNRVRRVGTAVGGCLRDYPSPEDPRPGGHVGIPASRA